RFFVITSLASDGYGIRRPNGNETESLMNRVASTLAGAALMLPLLGLGNQSSTVHAAVVASLPAATPTSRHESVVRLPIAIPYTMIEKLVNEKAPASVSGIKDNPTAALYDDTLRYTIARGAIEVSNGGNCIAITVPIHGSATAHGRFGARGWLG